MARCVATSSPFARAGAQEVLAGGTVCAGHGPIQAGRGPDI